MCNNRQQKMTPKIRANIPMADLTVTSSAAQAALRIRRPLGLDRRVNHAVNAFVQAVSHHAPAVCWVGVGWGGLSVIV